MKTRFDLLQTAGASAMAALKITDPVAADTAMLKAFQESGNDNLDYPDWKAIYQNTLNYLRSLQLDHPTRSAIAAQQPPKPAPGGQPQGPAPLPKTPGAPAPTAVATPKAP